MQKTFKQQNSNEEERTLYLKKIELKSNVPPYLDQNGCMIYIYIKNVGYVKVQDRCGIKRHWSVHQ